MGAQDAETAARSGLDSDVSNQLCRCNFSAKFFCSSRRWSSCFCVKRWTRKAIDF